MKVDIGTETIDIEIRELPEDFIEWQLEVRIESIKSIINGSFMGNFGPHLPALSTRSAKGDFPVNSAYKGVGLIPEEEYLDETIERFESAIEEYKDNWEESKIERLNLLLEFYENRDKIDTCKLGSVEIYGKRTYENILKDRRVSLLFLDLTKGSLSYMVDAVAEVYEPGTRYYRLEKALHDIFHKPVDERTFFCAYIFHTSRVYDKTPGSKAGDRIV